MKEKASQNLNPQDLLVVEPAWGGRGPDVLIASSKMGEEAWDAYVKYMVATGKWADEEERKGAEEIAKRFEDLMGFSPEDLKRAKEEKEKELWQEALEEW